MSDLTVDSPPPTPLSIPEVTPTPTPILEDRARRRFEWRFKNLFNFPVDEEKADKEFQKTVKPTKFDLWDCIKQGFGHWTQIFISHVQLIIESSIETDSISSWISFITAYLDNLLWNLQSGNRLLNIGPKNRNLVLLWIVYVIVSNFWQNFGRLGLHCSDIKFAGPRLDVEYFTAIIHCNNLAWYFFMTKLNF